MKYGQTHLVPFGMISAIEAARRLGVHRNVLYKKNQRGTLCVKFVKAGTRKGLYLSLADFRKLEQQFKQERLEAYQSNQ